MELSVVRKYLRKPYVYILLLLWRHEVHLHQGCFINTFLSSFLFPIFFLTHPLIITHAINYTYTGSPPKKGRANMSDEQREDILELEWINRIKAGRGYRGVGPGSTIGNGFLSGSRRTKEEKVVLSFSLPRSNAITGTNRVENGREEEE